VTIRISDEDLRLAVKCLEIAANALADVCRNDPGLGEYQKRVWMTDVTRARILSNTLASALKISQEGEAAG